MYLPPRLAWFLFDIYPYLCVTILLLGSLVRFDREPYSWKSDSSQIISKRQLRFGSNMFHYGVGVVLIGHLVGFLIPYSLESMILSQIHHELLAMVVGGIAGIFAIIGISVLVYRRLRYRAIRANSRGWDIAIVLMLWFQVALGLITIWYSAHALDSGEFKRLVEYVQSVAYFRGGGSVLLQGTPWVYQVHILLGWTIFLVSPFTRMVHIWSGVGTLAYLFRPYQLVRKDTRGANPTK